MLNYHYDPELGTYELYFNDALIVELPYTDPLTEKQAAALSRELFDEYLEGLANMGCDELEREFNSLKQWEGV